MSPGNSRKVRKNPPSNSDALLMKFHPLNFKEAPRKKRAFADLHGFVRNLHSLFHSSSLPLLWPHTRPVSSLVNHLSSSPPGVNLLCSHAGVLLSPALSAALAFHLRPPASSFLRVFGSGARARTKGEDVIRFSKFTDTDAAFLSKLLGVYSCSSSVPFMPSFV